MEEAPRATAAVVAAFLANAPLPPQSSAPVEPDADATVDETVQPAVEPEKD